MSQKMIGNSPLIHLSSFDGKKCGQLFIKDESYNPMGTWKDRRSSAIIEMCKQTGSEDVVLISNGNAGYSLAKLSAGKLRVHCVIDTQISSSIKLILQSVCYQVIETDLSRRLSSEQIIELTGKNSLDVTNGFHDVYGSIVDEIFSAKIIPTHIVCPVGSGEALVGIVEEIKKRGVSTRVIGARPSFHKSIADKLNACWTPYEEKIKELTQKIHTCVFLSEEEIALAYKNMRQYVSCEISGAIGFAVFEKYPFCSSDNVVLINSGKGIS